MYRLGWPRVWHHTFARSRELDLQGRLLKAHISPTSPLS
ncbi:MAG: hypothetical protein K0S19_1061 [Geminicoccaceae bacterium]|nr:hypothetical protein [Geminicoccaceae bacterium]